MAKIPTYESKQLSGVSGVTQMPAMKRAMTQAFKKSSNIKASDFYQAAGDQAMAQALGNIGALANKVAIQKNETELQSRKIEMRRQFALMGEELENQEKGASDYHKSWVEENRGSLTKFGIKKYDKQLEQEFDSLAINSSLAANSITSKASRIEWNSNREINRRALESEIGKIPIDDLIDEANRYDMAGVPAEIYGKTTAQELFKDNYLHFNTQLAEHFETNADDLKKANAAIDAIESLEPIIGKDKTDSLLNKLDSKIDKFQRENANGLYSQKQYLLGLAIKDGDYESIEKSPEFQELSNLISEKNAFQKFKDDLRSAALATDVLTYANQNMNASEIEIEKAFIDKANTPSQIKALKTSIKTIRENREELIDAAIDLQVESDVKVFSDSVASYNIEDIDGIKDHIVLKYGVKNQAKVESALNRVIKAYNSDPLGFHITKGSYGKQYQDSLSNLYNPDGTINNQAASDLRLALSEGFNYMRSKNPSFAQRVPVPIEKMLAELVDSEQPQALANGVALLNQLYGDNSGNALLEMTKGKSYKVNFNDEDFAKLTIAESLMRNNQPGFINKYQQGLKILNDSTASELKKQGIPTDDEVARMFPADANSNLLAKYNRDGYRALRLSGMSDSLAKELIYGQQVPVNDGTGERRVLSKIYTTPDGVSGKIENINQFNAKVSYIRSHIGNNIFDFVHEGDIAGMYNGRVQKEDGTFDFPDNIKKGLNSKNKDIRRETMESVMRNLSGSIITPPNGDIISVAAKSPGSAEFPIRGKDGKPLSFSTWYINENSVGLVGAGFFSQMANVPQEVQSMQVSKFIKEAK